MTRPDSARCDGRSVLVEVAAQPCPQAAPFVFSWACGAGHEGALRACGPHGLRIVTGQDTQPATVCPDCRGPAWFAVYCGRCRSGRHDECRALGGTRRAMAGLPPVSPEEHCACSCDPYAPTVDGIPGARGHREAAS